MTRDGAVTAAVFDLGGVLIDWNPRHLYRRLFGGDEAAMEDFLATVCSQAWNERQDRGRPFRDGVRELVARHPDKRALIEAYDRRWPEMVAGEKAETVALLQRLKDSGLALHALTNWSAEKFPHARARFPFLAWFETVVVSGEIGRIKPEPEIFEHLCRRAGAEPAALLFIDDTFVNIQAAARLGFQVHHFQGARALGRDLRARGLL